MKEFYRENRVLVILGVVVIICAIISSILLFKYFYYGNGNDKYGDRLEKIKDLVIEDKRQKEIVAKLEENKNVKSARIDIIGARVDFTINFNEEVSLVEAESAAVAILDEFSNEEKAAYNIGFNLLEEKTETNEGFNIWGAINAGREKIVWENNNPVSTPEEESEK